MTDKTKPRTTVAQDVAALRAVVDGQHAQTETTTEVQAEMNRFPDEFNGDDAKLIACIEALLSLDAKNALVPHGIGGHARGLLSAAMHRLSRALAAGKVVPETVGVVDGTDRGMSISQTATLLRPLKAGTKLYTAAPADPAKASAPDQFLLRAAREVLSTELGEMACVESHAPAENALGLLALAVAQYPECPAKAGGSFPSPLDASAPPKVWLQINTDGDAEDRSEAIPRMAWCNLTWHYESVGGQEVEYIRADLATPPASAPEVTESMVERACEEYLQEAKRQNFNPSEAWARSQQARDWMRAALTAALQQEGKSHG